MDHLWKKAGPDWRTSRTGTTALKMPRLSGSASDQLRACLLLALACAAYGGYVSPYLGLGYGYYGHYPYAPYAGYGVYRAPVYHTVHTPVKYVVPTPTIAAKVTDTYETHPGVPVSVSKVAGSYVAPTVVHAVPTATKVVSTAYTPTVAHVPTYYGYGVSPYGLSYGYGVGGYHYAPILKKCEYTLSRA
ncbi:hypothetical protein V5799_012816 [Amblyomma americanum]|uniref:Cuticle protein n=1 Tax=Amblyomma americanum TaxID=6943 RepID=A0AAQ4E7S5_AMBAM